MEICLKTHAKQTGSRTVKLSVEERKPVCLNSSCELTCEFQVEACQNYYLLTLDVSGMFDITCQRCLGDFQQEYTNQTQLAICASEDIAETLMASFECIVVNDYKVDLIDIVTDELHLFLPEKHADVTECDLEISSMIGELGD